MPLSDVAADARSYYNSVHQQAYAKEQQQQQHKQPLTAVDEDEFGSDFLSDDVLLSMVP